MSYDGTDQIPGPGEQPQVPGPSPQGRADQSTTTATPRQLVRDPYSRLGGVASGLAHYFGIDVSIVRLGFVLFTIFSGVGLVVYLLAWLVVPRAEFWPPSTVARPLRSISAREIGIGIAVLGALLFLFFNGGGTARVLVPVLLVAGGVWLLRQPEAVAPPFQPTAPPQTPSAVSSAIAPVSPSYPAPDERTRIFDDTDPTLVGDPFSRASAPQPADTLTPPLPPPPLPVPLPPGQATVGGLAPGTPVPPRRRRWWRVVIPLLLFFVVVPILAILALLIFVIGNGVDIDAGFDSQYRPQTIEEIPSTIDQDAGEIVLDLTELDLEAFLPVDPVDPVTPTTPGASASASTDLSTVPEVLEPPELPIPIDIELGFGEVRVIVPEGLEIDVDAEADLGEVEVFGRSEDGIDNDVTFDGDDPAIDLEIRLGAGSIVVERG